MFSTEFTLQMIWELHEAIRVVCVWGMGTLAAFSLALYVILITQERHGASRAHQ